MIKTTNTFYNVYEHYHFFVLLNIIFQNLHPFFYLSLHFLFLFFPHSFSFLFHVFVLRLPFLCIFFWLTIQTTIFILFITWTITTFSLFRKFTFKLNNTFLIKFYLFYTMSAKEHFILIPIPLPWKTSLLAWKASLYGNIGRCLIAFPIVW